MQRGIILEQELYEFVLIMSCQKFAAFPSDQLTYELNVY